MFYIVLTGYGPIMTQRKNNKDNLIAVMEFVDGTYTPKQSFIWPSFASTMQKLDAESSDSEANEIDGIFKQFTTNQLQPN